MTAREIRLKVDGKKIYQEIKFTISYEAIYLDVVFDKDSHPLLKQKNKYHLSINDYSLGNWYLMKVSKIKEDYLTYTEYMFIAVKQRETPASRIKNAVSDFSKAAAEIYSIYKPKL